MPAAKPSWFSRWDVTVVVAALVVVGAVGVGAVLTGRAIMDGSVAGSLWRFAAATAIGTYYLVLYRTAQRRR